MAICRNGPQCRFLKKGRCWFSHPPQDLKKTSPSVCYAKKSQLRGFNKKIQVKSEFHSNSVKKQIYDGEIKKIQTKENSQLSEIKEQKKYISLFVKANSKTTALSSLNLQSLVSDIYKKLGLSEKQQKFIYNGKILKPSKTLNDSLIQDGSTITQIPILVGGGFFFNSLTNKIERGFTKIDITNLPQEEKTLHKIRVVKPGLNLLGTCENKRCLVYQKWSHFWLNLGFGKFYIEVQLNKSNCPVCKEKVRPMNLGYYDCEITFQGKRERQNDNVQWKDNGEKNHFTTYQQGDDNLQKWQFLIAEVSKKRNQNDGDNCL